MRIIVFEGTFKTTTFINRLVVGLSSKHDVYILGFNETLNTKLPGINYVGLGSNSSWFTFIKRSLQLRGFNFLKQLELFGLLLKREKKKIIASNLQLAIDAIQPDIIHFQWVGVLSYLENLKLSKKTKTVFSQRGFHINVRPFVDANNMNFLKEIFPKIDGFHSVSKAIREKSKEIYNSDSKIDHVVYSGFDYKNISVKSKSEISDVIQLLSVGRSHWKKDYKTAIKAMAILKKENIAFHYTIIGVQEDEELLFMRSDLGLTKHVSFVSNINQQEVYCKMIASDLFLLPSIEEGIANVCIEAMFCNLPVLSTDCGGMTELIEDNTTGFITSTRSPEKIANKIKEISKVGSKELDLITFKAREKVMKQHSVTKMVTDMELLYSNILNKENE